MLQQKKNVLFCGKGNAYEFTNGEEIKIDGSREFNKDKIKFVSYSNKIKPEIQNLFDKLNVKEYSK